MQKADVPRSSEVRLLIDAGRYDDAELLAERIVSSATAQAGAQSLPVASATDLLVEARLRNGKGAQTSTLELAKQTLRVKEGLLLSDDVQLVSSLTNLGQVLLAAGDSQQAVALLQRALNIREAAHDTLDVEMAAVLDDLARAQLKAGREDEARQSLDRALAVREKALGTTSPVLASTLELMGRRLQRKGEYSEARRVLDRALKLREITGSNHPDMIETLNLLGDQAWFEGSDPRTVQAFYVRALSIGDSALRPDHPLLARVLQNLATSATDLGDLNEARSLLERAVSIAERNYGPMHPDVAGLLNDLAITLRLQGDYPAARVLYERGLRIVDARKPRDDNRYATFAYNLGLVHKSLGDFAEARHQYDRARIVWQRAYGADHPYVARAIGALAEVSLEQGRYAEARQLFEQALRIQERRLRRDHRNIAETLSSLARTLERQGQPSAQQFSARAVEMWKRLNAADSPTFAQLLTLHANLQANRGEFDSARRDYERALEIRSRVLGKSHPLYAETQAGLAVAFAGLGDKSSAIAAALQSDETTREHLRTTLRYLPERQSLGFAASRPKTLDLAISVAEDPATTNRLFDAVMKSRALVLDEMAARRNVRPNGPADDLNPLWAALVKARQRLANLVVRGPSEDRPEQYAKLIEDARLEKESAERALADSSASFRQELTHDAIGLEMVRGSLPQGSALVAFVRYERIVMAGSLNVRAAPVDARRPLRKVASYMAFVILAGEPDISMLPLGSASTVDTLVEAWRDALTNIARTTSTSDAEKSYRVAGVSLRRRVWDPIASRLKGVRTVFIVPDGTLNLLSFAALPLARTRYLVDDGPVIHYLSAERDLVANATTATSNVGMLAVGGAAFDDATAFTVVRKRTPADAPAKSHLQANLRGACADLASLQFETLGATGEEIHEVARLWGDSPVQLLENRRATERSFKESAPGHRVLHLATHGFFLGSECEQPMGGTRAVRRLTIASRPPPSSGTVENPLLLSGLAFAGANRRAAAGPKDEDGILTAEEVATLNLEGVEWAVLSACNTGLGEIKAGEGVLGLRRAFQLAGVHTVIMSLWQVEDQAARVWMRALYEGRLKKKLSTAEAVHQASLTALRTRRSASQSTHPFYWAAFVAAGDWK